MRRREEEENEEPKVGGGGGVAVLVGVAVWTMTFQMAKFGRM